MRRRSLLAALVASVSLSSTTAKPVQADQEPSVEWNEAWPRVRLVEVANIVALTVGSVVIHDSPYQHTAHWNGPILFDKPVRQALLLETAHGQETIANISDYVYRGMVLAPYVVDNYIAALGVHQNVDVALQMTLINMQSLGLSGVLALGAEHAVGRARPYTLECPPGGLGPTKTGFNHCGLDIDNQSFFSGHAAAAFTMAGLTCVHHAHLPLYGGGLPDKIACWVMLAGASATGIARIMSDRHWASDVLLGAGVGLFNGYMLPSFLHYGFGGGRTVRTTVQTAIGTVAPVPQVYSDGAGLGVAVF